MYVGLGPMAGLERASELRQAGLVGSPQLLNKLAGWEPAVPGALLAPMGTSAEVVQIDELETGDDFDGRRFRRVWLRVTTSDGRGALIEPHSLVVVPSGAISEVIFKPSGAPDGPDPEGGLEAMFIGLLGPHVEALHAELKAEILQTGDLGRAAFEPASLDPLLRPVFWRFFGHRAAGRELQAALEERPAGLDSQERAELRSLVSRMRNQAFRDGVAVGVALRSADLHQDLAQTIAAKRAVEGKQRGAGKARGEARARASLAAEHKLYLIWRDARAYLERNFLSKAIPGELGRRLAGALSDLPTHEHIEAQSDWTIGKMIRLWKQGRDPTVIDQVPWTQWRPPTGN